MSWHKSVATLTCFCLAAARCCVSRGIETSLVLLPAGSSTVLRHDGLQDKGCSFAEQGSPCCKAPRRNPHTGTASCQRRARFNSKANYCCRSELIFVSHSRQDCSQGLLVKWQQNDSGLLLLTATSSVQQSLLIIAD